MDAANGLLEKAQEKRASLTLLGDADKKAWSCVGEVLLDEVVSPSG